jgi:hypothetical protein
MTDDQVKAWVADPGRADTFPFGVCEPAYRKGITGAALVVRGFIYFRNRHTSAVREALVNCYEQYQATVDEYRHALEIAADHKLSSDGALRWFYTEGSR